MEMVLVPLCRFRETDGRPGDPSIFDARRFKGTPAEIVDYLDADASGLYCMEYCFDPFDGSPIGPLLLKTDGRFAWRSDLPYSVRKHDIALPQEFVDHAVRMRSPPAVENFEFLIPALMAAFSSNE